jgi:hypothetical protein
MSVQEVEDVVFAVRIKGYGSWDAEEMTQEVVFFNTFSEMIEFIAQIQRTKKEHPHHHATKHFIEAYVEQSSFNSVLQGRPKSRRVRTVLLEEDYQPHVDLVIEQWQREEVANEEKILRRRAKAAQRKKEREALEELEAVSSIFD